MERERPGTAHQAQTGFLGSAVALAVVALVAAGDEVLPGGVAPAGTRHDVVERELGSGERPAAELARIAIAQKDILAREGAGLLGNVAIGQQANDGRNLEGARG